MPQQTAAAELAGLRAELEKPAAAPSRPAAAPAEPPSVGASESQLQIDQFLQQLRAALDEATQNTEDVIAEHPLPAVSAAFLLGLTVGWLAARG